jgi:hypothetical protein
MVNTEPSQEPIRRQLPSGMIVEAVNDVARQAWDPLLVIDELERQWKETSDD